MECGFSGRSGVARKANLPRGGGAKPKGLSQEKVAGLPNERRLLVGSHPIRALEPSHRSALLFLIALVNLHFIVAFVFDAVSDVRKWRGQKGRNCAQERNTREGPGPLLAQGHSEGHHRS